MSTLEMTWGTTKSWDVAALDQDDQPLNLAGKTLRFIVKSEYADTDANAVFELTEISGIAVPGAGGNDTAVVTVIPANTQSLDRTKTHSLRYQFLLIEGSDRFPLREGLLIVGPSVAE